jgi:hypothetical protein
MPIVRHRLIEGARLRPRSQRTEKGAVPCSAGLPDLLLRPEIQ